MEVISIANRVQALLFQPNLDDDFADRLNYRYTAAILVLFATIVFTRQFGAEANIKCWNPAFFTKSYDSYVSRICWVSNTYQVNENENIPKEEVERRQHQIKYYQWVSFILLFQATMFYLPRIFWNTASSKCGFSISNIIEAANNCKKAEKFDEYETKYMRYLITNLDQYLDDPRRIQRKLSNNRFIRAIQTSMICSGRFMGNYLVILYFIIKLLYLGNAIMQIAILSALLGYNFLNFGIDFMRTLAKGEGWITDSKYFPKTAYCDFTIREMGNPQKVHRYTVQCVLPINLFNQQIFIIIWFWYFIVIMFNFIDLIKWTIRSLPHKPRLWLKRRVGLIYENVLINDKVSPKLEHFTNAYLKPDGIFLLLLVANNTGDYVATNLIHELWKKHHERYKDLFLNEEIEDKCEILIQNDNLILHKSKT